jgi:hypothetical protein
VLGSGLFGLDWTISGVEEVGGARWQPSLNRLGSQKIA